MVPTGRRSGRAPDEGEVEGALLPLAEFVGEEPELEMVLEPEAVLEAAEPEAEGAVAVDSAPLVVTVALPVVLAPTVVLALEMELTAAAMEKSPLVANTWLMLVTLTNSSA